MRQTSGSGRLTASIMTSEKDKDAEYVMVMDEDGSMTTIDLKAADKHGKVSTLITEILVLGDNVSIYNYLQYLMKLTVIENCIYKMLHF